MRGDWVLLFDNGVGTQSCDTFALFADDFLATFGDVFAEVELTILPDDLDGIETDEGIAIGIDIDFVDDGAACDHVAMYVDRADVVESDHVVASW